MNAFSRSKAIFAAISAALAGGMAMNFLATLPEFQYVSRGKGKGRIPSKNYLTSHSKYMPHQGKKECARRVKQISISK